MQSLKFIHVYLISDCYRFVPVTMRGDIKQRFSCKTALLWDFKEDRTETVNLSDAGWGMDFLGTFQSRKDDGKLC